MSWRGTQGGIDAAKQGHQVVMSPLQYTYVDLMQGDPYVEPPEFGILLLDQSYKFDPIPKGVDPNLILGGEACLWSEHTTNMRAAGYLLWPRSMAVAECVWSPAENKKWTDFVRRAENHFERMDVAQIKYSRSMYNPVFHASQIRIVNWLLNCKHNFRWTYITHSMKPIPMSFIRNMKSRWWSLKMPCM
jgi:hexosaminidase